MYSNIAEEEDEKITRRWRSEADGTLLFTGLFSAAVSTLLTMTMPLLSQDELATNTSFYTQKIYELLAAERGVSDVPTPSTFPYPPPLFPSKYAICVNVLWSLSFVISISSALLATLLHQWAYRYLEITQPPRCRPEKRARMRAFFANGTDKMGIPVAVKALPAMVHLSLFLFFAGFLVYLAHVNQSVFHCVLSWTVLFSTMYAVVTIMPIFRHDSPYYAPLSSSTWLLYAGAKYVVVNILLAFGRIFIYETSGSLLRSQDRYRGWIFGGVQKAAEEAISKQSSEIDLRILDWTLGTLGEDDALEKFFMVIPAFFCSSLVEGLKEPFSSDIAARFRTALVGLLDRTLSSSSVVESVKVRRLGICLDATNTILGSIGVCSILDRILKKHIDQVQQSLEMGYILANWCSSADRIIAGYAQCMVARVLVHVRERDHRWIGLAADVFGLPEHILQNNIVHGDSALLAILIHVTRNRSPQADSPDSWTRIVSSFAILNVRHTLPIWQHRFCCLWNEIAREARNQGDDNTLVDVLRRLRKLYIDLHQDTDAAPTAFSASTRDTDQVLCHPSTYPLCNIPSHLQGPGDTFLRPSPLAPRSTLSRSIAPRRAREAVAVAPTADMAARLFEHNLSPIQESPSSTSCQSSNLVYATQQSTSHIHPPVGTEHAQVMHPYSRPPALSDDDMAMNTLGLNDPTSGVHTSLSLSDPLPTTTIQSSGSDDQISTFSSESSRTLERPGLPTSKDLKGTTVSYTTTNTSIPDTIFHPVHRDSETQPERQENFVVRATIGAPHSRSSSRNLASPHSSDVIPPEPSSSTLPALIPSSHGLISHALQSPPSTSVTASYRTTPGSGARGPMGRGTFSMYDDVTDTMPNLGEPTHPPPDIEASTSQTRDDQNFSNES